jgi:hypothetical protein
MDMQRRLRKAMMRGEILDQAFGPRGHGYSSGSRREGDREPLRGLGPSGQDRESLPGVPGPAINVSLSAKRSSSMVIATRCIASLLGCLASLPIVDPIAAQWRSHRIQIMGSAGGVEGNASGRGCAWGSVDLACSLPQHRSGAAYACMPGCKAAREALEPIPAFEQVAGGSI